eukprot:m51a1_g2302 hypothetical protein (180) ;mRNA; r:445837-446376
MVSALPQRTDMPYDEAEETKSEQGTSTTAGPERQISAVSAAVVPELEALEVVSLEELDLNSVVQGHKAWIAKLRQLIMDGKTLKEDLKTAHDANTCSFGRWLETKGPKSFKDPRVYHHLKSLHEKFHQASSKLISLSLEDLQQAQSQISREDSPINSISQKLITSLGVMQKRQVAAAFS